MSTDAIERRAAAEAAVHRTVLRYGYAIDVGDHGLLRSVFTDDAELHLPGLEPVRGGDAVVETIAAAASGREWQHHVIAVAASGLRSPTGAWAHSNVISHKTFPDRPHVVVQLCGTYADELRLVDGDWRIAHKSMVVGSTQELPRLT